MPGGHFRKEAPTDTRHFGYTSRPESKPAVVCSAAHRDATNPPAVARHHAMRHQVTAAIVAVVIVVIRIVVIRVGSDKPEAADEPAPMKAIVESVVEATTMEAARGESAMETSTSAVETSAAKTAVAAATKAAATVAAASSATAARERADGTARPIATAAASANNLLRAMICPPRTTAPPQDRTLARLRYFAIKQM